MTKKMLLCTWITAFTCLAKSQSNVNLDLYFYQESINTVYCGVSKNAQVLLFVSDTAAAKLKSNQYYIVLECPEFYGDGFFKKNSKYHLHVGTNDKMIKKYIIPQTLKELRGYKVYWCYKIIKE